MKPSLFVIEQYIKQIQKGGKLNGINHEKITQKDMVNDEVGVTNYVFHV